MLTILFLLSLLPTISVSQSPNGLLIDCGAAEKTVINGQEWLPDSAFVSTGVPKNLTTTVLDPTLATLRTFPLQNNVLRKFCYVVPVNRLQKYMVRTTYFYGEVNGNANPPVFDQIVDGTFWNVVNTTEDYVNGMSSYYEGIFLAVGKTMSVCLAANTYTDSDPFISALEIVLLGDSLYNSTDFKSYALSLIARHSFGYAGPIIRFPDDQFDRYWEPFGEINYSAPSFRNVSVSGFWNLPPLKVFQTRLANAQPEPMTIQWPPSSLPNATYYISLLFADDHDSNYGSSRVFNVTINDVLYYPDLTVTSAGVDVFANQWPLAGFTSITLTPTAGSTIGPLINAGEIFEVLPLGGRTHTGDVIALYGLKGSFKNSPFDWNGDPCLPRQYSWTGVTCSGGRRIRVTSLNLTSMGLSGSISLSIAKLTALTDLWLGNNSLSGAIPDLGSLKRLETLHLEGNQLGGEIPPSLGSIVSLREIFLQNNNLTGQVPTSLLGKPGLDLRITPGNRFLSSSTP